MRCQRRRALLGSSVHGLDRLVDLTPFARGCRIWKLTAKASPTDEIEAAITPESWHTVEKRETFDAASERCEMLLEGLEAFDSVPNPCCVFEVEAGHGPSDVAFEYDEWLASPPFQEAPCGRYLAPISFAARSPATRCQAGAQLGPHAERRPSLAEDFQLIVKKHRCGARAIPEAHGVSQIPNRAAHLPDCRKGSEVEGSIGNGTCDGQDPGRGFPRELHEGKRPLSLVLPVEPGLPTLNESHLTYQRRKLVRDVFPPNSARFPDQPGRFFPGRSPEVREESRAYADRLSYIQRVSIGAQHVIDTRTVFGMGPHIFAEGGGGHGCLKILRRSGVNSSRFDFRLSFGKSFGKYRVCRRKEPLPQPVGSR